MSFDEVERLKKQFTDKFVVVDAAVPELKRFKDWTGTVKTVNMSGRALVQFDAPADISWYDIDLSYLRVVDQPVKKAPEKHAEPAEKKAAPGPAAAKPAGKSPLELARAQGAGGAAKPAAPVAGGAKPLSKLEQARLQGAGGAAAAAPAAGAKPLSKLEQARLQGAGAASKVTAPAEPVAAADVPAPPAAESAPPAAPAAPPPAAPGGKPLSKIELARLQGAKKPG